MSLKYGPPVDVVVRALLILLSLLLAAIAAPIALASGGHDGGEEPEAAEGVTSPELMPGESWTFNVTAEGVFDYHCHPHPWMLAQLRILPSNGTPTAHLINITEPEGADFEDWTFAPQITDVRVGDSVTWVNQGTVMHRVSQTVGEHIEHVGVLGGQAEAASSGQEEARVSSAPSALWWVVVAAAGVACVALWVKGGKKQG